MAEVSGEFLGQSGLVGDFAPPDGQNIPAQALKFLSHAHVSRHVAGEFAVPERRVRLRPVGESTALMSVPVASMDEYYLTQTGEDQVGRARQVAAMESEPETQPVRRPPHGHLRLGVATADAGHQRRATFARDRVHAKSSSLRVTPRRGRPLVALGSNSATYPASRPQLIRVSFQFDAGAGVGARGEGRLVLGLRPRAR